MLLLNFQKKEAAVVAAHLTACDLREFPPLAKSEAAQGNAPSPDAWVHVATTRDS